MDNRRHASLVLNSSYLIRNVDTNFRRTLLTWNNINLRNLLGDMYEQFDYFNISLKSITTVSTENISGVRDTFALHVRMSGLPWVNNSYNVKSGSNNQYCVIGTFRLASFFEINFLYENNLFTFGKNSETCNITIDFLKISDGDIPNIFSSPTVPFSNFIFMFDIVGIPKTMYLTNN